MRGEKLLKILELFENATYNAAGFFEAFITSTKVDRRPLVNFRFKEHVTFASGIRQRILEREKLSKYIHKLRKEGLVEFVNGGRGLLRLTAKGKIKIGNLKKFFVEAIPVKKYSRITSANITIIGFDIPEKQSKKRHWLRRALKNLGFQMLQKSVWIGKISLPGELLEDLAKLGLLPYLEIFSVGQKGTIKKL
ncbi:MAG: CRISPR-associated endonuclease Cas2 [Patescibacteria group bacterium]